MRCHSFTIIFKTNFTNFKLRALNFLLNFFCKLNVLFGTRFNCLSFPCSPFGQSFAPLPFGHCKPLTKPHNVLSIGHVCIIDGSMLPCHNLLVYHCHYPLLLSLTEQSFHYYGRNHCPIRRLLLTKLMPAALALNCNFVSFCCTVFMHLLSLMHYSCTTIT